MAPAPEFALLLDAILPLEATRVDYRGWDDRQWGRALQCADWHRLAPVLFCHLRARGDVPEPVFAALERTYLASAARSMFLAASLERVLDALREAGAPAMLLKGAALVESVYRDPAQREMLDVDILIPPERLEAANSALLQLGYNQQDRSREPGAESTRLERWDHHGPPLIGEQRLLAVELHHHVAIAEEGVSFSMDPMWERALPSTRGEHVLPSPEDLLLHVCLHFMRGRVGGSYHGGQTGGALGQICDIARIVEVRPLDWDVVVAVARSYGIEARVFLALFVARRLGVAIPQRSLSSLEPPGFDPRVGDRLVALRVLRAGDHLPVRSLRWMLAPTREVLSRGWNADSTATLSLARAYLRRGRAYAPAARSTLRQPWSFVQDQRLNGELRALEERL